jgi:dTDP-4-dehydrorhamnose reductase
MQGSPSGENRTFLVTGVSGLLGLNLAKQLTSQGATVYGISWRKAVQLELLHHFLCDLRDADRLKTEVERLAPEVIVHCAAATDVDWCEKNPGEAFAINARPCADLAVAANRISATLVLVSTDSVFDGATGNYRESDEPKPLNAYARSKLAAEQLVSAQAKKWIIIRANLYGWNGQQKNSLAEWIVQELRLGRTITGFEDVVFAPLLASDLGQLIIRIVKHDLGGLYHAGARDAMSKYEFARVLADICGLNGGLIKKGRLADVKLTAPRPLNTALVSSKLAADLGEAMPLIEEGLKRFRDEGMNGWAQQLKTHIR